MHRYQYVSTSKAPQLLPYEFGTLIQSFVRPLKIISLNSNVANQACGWISWIEDGYDDYWIRDYLYKYIGIKSK